jgi:hypothetical protein
MDAQETPANAVARNATIDALSGTLAELLFVALPLIVLSVVGVLRNKMVWEIVSNPEWSFAAAILFGQAAVRFVSGAARHGAENWQRVVLAISLILVVGLVPSLVVMTLVLLSEAPAVALVWSQMGFFAAGAIAFLAFGSAGDLAIEGLRR